MLPLGEPLTRHVSLLLQAETLRNRYGGSAGLAKALGVDPEKGLGADDPADLQARAEWFGANRVPIPKQRSLLLLMWDALHDVMLIVLMIAGLISLICGLAFSEERGVCAEYALDGLDMD